MIKLADVLWRQSVPVPVEKVRSLRGSWGHLVTEAGQHLVTEVEQHLVTEVGQHLVTEVGQHLVTEVISCFAHIRSRKRKPLLKEPLVNMAEFG